MTTNKNKKKSHLLWLTIAIIIIISIFSTSSIYNSTKDPDAYLFPTAETKKQYKPAAKALAIELTTYNQQFTVLSDTNHANMNILDFIADDTTMQSFANLGYKNIFLEIRQEFQRFADKVISGEMTPEEYAQAKIDEYAKFGHTASRKRSIYEAKIIRSAAKHGLNVFCSEGQKLDLKAHSDTVQQTNDISRLYYDTMESIRVKNIFLNPPQLIKMLISHLRKGGSRADRMPEVTVDAYKALIDSDTSLSRILFMGYKTTMKIRLHGDVELAEFIKSKANNDKSIVLYGAAHGRYKCDLDDHLKAKRIEVFSNMLDARFGWQDTQISDGELTTSLVIDKGEIFDKKAVNDNVIKGFKLPEEYQINLCAGTDDSF